MTDPHMQHTLRKLRLSGLAASLDLRLREARGNNLDHLEFLELLRHSTRHSRSAHMRQPKEMFSRA